MGTWEERHDAGVTFPAGFRVAAGRCGLKTQGDDLALIVADAPAAVAGVFTTNLVRAASVDYSAGVAARGVARAVIANAGNANACNGDAGMRDTRCMAELAASVAGAEAREVLVASTGVIGHPMAMDRLERGIPALGRELAAGPAADQRAAHAIMTTDTRPKQMAAECTAQLWGGPIRFGAMCKGAGMIAPRLGPPHATMLCFLTCDARVRPSALQWALELAVARTLNRVTVDGDTSTNDMVVLMASGAGRADLSSATPGGDELGDFVDALERVCGYLAREIARDGEGATKLVEVVVRGAASEEAAERVGRTIAESPLVKTALFGSDPNWGRILAAAGRAGVSFRPAEAWVQLGDTCVYADGQAAQFDALAAHEYLKGPEVRLVVDLGAGSHEATFWTCDYSYDYVRINAEYHT